MNRTASLTRSPSWWWWGVAAVVMAFWVAAGAYTAWRLRSETLSNALQKASLQAHSLEDSLTQSLRTLELLTNGLEPRLDRPVHWPSLAQDLTEAVRPMSYLRSLSVADASGRIMASTDPANVGQVVSVDDLFPRAPAETPMLRLGSRVVGRDWSSRIDESRASAQAPTFVPVAQPLWAGQSLFWLVASLNPDHFVTHARTMLQEAQARVHWVRYDGASLWSTVPQVGRQAEDDEVPLVARLVVKEEIGRLEHQSPQGPAVLTAYRASSRYPAIVSVSLDRDAALARWRHDTQRRALLVLPWLLVVLALGVYVWRRQHLLAEQEAQLVEQRLLAARVFESSSDAILVTSPDACIVSVNPAFEHLTGYSAQEVAGQNPRMLGSGAHPRAFFEAIWAAVLQQEGWRGVITNRHKSGVLYQASVTINAIRGADGRIHHLTGVMRDVTDESRIQAALRDSEERMALALQGGDLASWDWDVPSGHMHVNARWCQMLGLPVTDMVDVGVWEERVHPDDLDRIQQDLNAHLEGRTPQYACEHRLRHAEGRWVWVLDSGRLMSRLADGTPLRMVGTHLDITARKQTEDQLLLAASVFSHAQEAIMITDPAGVMIEVNDAFLRITGYERHEVLGRNTGMLSSGRQSKDFYQAMWRELGERGRWTGEIWNRRKSGEVYAELLTISAVQNHEGQVLRYVALFSDITRQKEHEQQLERIAHFDALTGLPNRVLLSDRLHQAMAHALRRGTTLAVVFLDLDGFKGVNDTHGHATGDLLLVALAERMKQALRDGDTLARLGGDEFVAVLHDLPDHEACVPVLERLRQAAAQPVVLDGGLGLQVSASLGLAFYPQTDDIDADQLMRQADQAMYQAKLSGKNRYHVFDAQHDRSLRHRHENLESIHHALVSGQLELHYQPKVNMRTGLVIGMEALIRWNHPEHGLLGPSAFLPTIENHPLGIELGQWVLQQAVQQIGTWKALGLNLPVSVNLDAQQLQEHGLADWLRQLLQRHPLVRPGDLRLEVLETTALDDVAQVSAVMRACQQEGVDFALDDFGTGYSSLTYLRRLPARELKIDQSFVRDMLDDADDLAILQGVLGLARAFQRDVIAEGVETVAHGRMLLRMGCEHGQGYAIARPMPAHEVAGWCRQWRPDPSWLHLSRVPTDDLPVLFAAAEHRSWLRTVQSCLRGERSAPSSMDGAACHFGQWLHGLPKEHRYRQLPLFAEMELLHEQVHTLAHALLAQTVQAPSDLRDDLPDGWAHLQAVSDQLLRHLLTLADPQPPAPS